MCRLLLTFLDMLRLRSGPQDLPASRGLMVVLAILYIAGGFMAGDHQGQDFVQELQKRYGFCIDQAPSGMAISNELLQLNRNVLERRLRDLGLLTGVNDAETMKQLKPRFTRQEEDDYATE